MNKEGFYVLPDAIAIMDSLNDAAMIRASLIMQMACDYNLSVGEARRECLRTMRPAFDMSLPLEANSSVAYQIYQLCEVLPAPARCNDIPFEVLESGQVITTTHSLAQARVSVGSRGPGSTIYCRWAA